MPNEMTAKAIVMLDYFFKFADQNNKEEYTHCAFRVDTEQTELLSYILSILRKVDRGELREVVHGEWIDNPEKFFVVECSNCKKCQLIRTCYCPSCGAIMDGKEPDDAKAD